MDSAHAKIVMIGNPIMDISIEDHDSKFIQKYKLELNSACLATEEHMPIYDEIFNLEGRQIIPGGSALNSARAAQHLITKSGSDAKVAYLGCIGKDLKGEALEKSVKDAGMLGHFAKDDEVKTGTCAVVVVGKERTLCANLGACCKYPMDHLLENIVS
jgi:adenosine kinase